MHVEEGDRTSSKAENGLACLTITFNLPLDSPDVDILTKAPIDGDIAITSKDVCSINVTTNVLEGMSITGIISVKGRALPVVNGSTIVEVGDIASSEL